MVDAVDSFLNNAVDLYIQAVKYCRISTSQIPTPVGAGIRQIRSESGKIWQTSPDSGDIVPDSGQTGRDPGQIRPFWPRSGRFLPDFGKNGQIPATLPEFVSAKY
jgi:hypothetical protein